MAIIRHELVFRGTLSALGAFNSQLVADCLTDGNITGVYFKASSVVNFTDSWYFGLKVNGVNVLLTTDRPQITSGTLNPSKTGLSIPVSFRDQLQPTVDARGLGSVVGPVTVIIDVDNLGSDLATVIHAATDKATPVDADEFPIVDSAASYALKHVTLTHFWANYLKAKADALYAALTGNQTIAGVKTFSSSPIVPTPSGGTDAANKTYVDAMSTGLSWKSSVRAATTVAGTLASSFANGQVIDGVTLATNDRILIKNQVAGADNGIYTVNASGAPTRATDADTGAELLACSMYVREGTSNADKQFVCTNDSITLGSTAITFATLATGSGDMISTNNLSDVANPSTARTNLGLAIGTNVQAWDTDLDTWATKTAPSGTVLGTTDTQTLTNKRVTNRVGTTASSATPTPDADANDEYTVTALAAGATFAAPSGTPTEGQTMIIRIKDNGTARSLAWNAIYRAIGVTLPTTTVISKTLYIGMIYNNTDTKWDVIGINQEA